MTNGAGSPRKPARRPFAVPGTLAGQGIVLRPQTEHDVPFLTRLYISLRWEEVQVVQQWTDEDRLVFLTDQFQKQYQHYATHYNGSDFLIIEKDGEPIGRLGLDRGNDADLRVVDIGFLPEWRGKGLGAAFLTAVQDEARAEGKKASIHVEQENPAKRLYARLGFRDVKQNGPYWLMHWHADPA
jgi:ribosomal protein S18 acetylase RimI-like enzyme